MRGIGWTLIAIGIGLVIWSLTVTTTIHTDPTYLAGLGYQEARDTYNLGLLQQQMMLLQAGLAAFVAGAIVASLGDLKAAMRRAGTAKYVGFFESLEAAPAAEPKE